MKVMKPQNEFWDSLISRFSSYTFFLKVFSIVMKFVCNMKIRNDPQISNGSSMLDTEYFIVKIIQRMHFPDIVKYLENPSGTVPAMVKRLHLKLVDGIVRCIGRLENSDLVYDSKFPILIPSESPFTSLIINYVHKLCGHGVVNYVVVSLRKKWWISFARQRVRSLIRKCIICKRLHGKPYATPQIPPYPSGDTFSPIRSMIEILPP